MRRRLPRTARGRPRLTARAPAHRAERKKSPRYAALQLPTALDIRVVALSVDSDDETRALIAQTPRASNAYSGVDGIDRKNRGRRAEARRVHERALAAAERHPGPTLSTTFRAFPFTSREWQLRASRGAATSSARSALPGGSPKRTWSMYLVLRLPARAHTLQRSGGHDP